MALKIARPVVLRGPSLSQFKFCGLIQPVCPGSLIEFAGTDADPVDREEDDGIMEEP
jgi:hypothetical protein